MRKIGILLILFVIFLIGFAIWWSHGTAPVDKDNATQTTFVVKPGEGLREIANRLKSDNLINSSVAFFLLTKKMGIDGQIEAGDFRLSPNMSAEEVARTLTHGTLDNTVTIPEGKRATEVAGILKATVPTYSPSWATKLANYEGYLFPDTYRISHDATIDSIITQMTSNFDKKYATLNTTNSKLTKNQIVTLASMVEREARFPQDRPLVASVFLNRLNLGMALQLDATVQYAVASIKCQTTDTTCNWWPNNLTIQDIRVNSPYNTYQNPGLPPTPIANPGLSALQAVVSPAKTDYLYYLSDAKGHIHFAKTLEEHNQNIIKYGQ